MHYNWNKLKKAVTQLCVTFIIAYFYYKSYKSCEKDNWNENHIGSKKVVQT